MRLYEAIANEYFSNVNSTTITLRIFDQTLEQPTPVVEQTTTATAAAKHKRDTLPLTTTKMILLVRMPRNQVWSVEQATTAAPCANSELFITGTATTSSCFDNLELSNSTIGTSRKYCQLQLLIVAFADAEPLLLLVISVVALTTEQLRSTNQLQAPNKCPLQKSQKEALVCRFFSI